MFEYYIIFSETKRISENRRHKMINQDRLVENFLDMVKIPSPSKKEREVADYLVALLKDLGMEVVEDNAGEMIGGNAGNVIGVLKAPGKKKLLFSSHMDTVLPCDKITPIVEDGIIKTDGTSVLGGDDKAGIAAIIEMIRVIKENNLDHPEIIVVFSVAEEIGLLGAQHFDVDKYKPDFGFIIDTGGQPGNLTVQAPAAVKGKITITGKPAHAGIAPEEGINALTVAAHAITKLRLGRIDAETTSNIGVVRGGQAVNIVMPEVKMMYEARSLRDEKLDALVEETMDIFKKTCEEFGAEFESEVKKGYSSFNIDTDSEAVKMFGKACEAAGIQFTTLSSGGGSDTNVYNLKNIPSVNMAIGMSKVHTKEEFIAIKDMVDCSKILVELVRG